MTSVFIDYARFYYASIAGTEAPPLLRGKFVQIRNENTLYLVFSPAEFTKYHADIVERFCMDKGLEGNYDREAKRFDIYDHAWDVRGGGKFELDREANTIRLFDNSLAYGKFDAPLLRETMAALPEFSGFTVLIE
jgi:hypothetical protein